MLRHLITLTAFLIFTGHAAAELVSFEVSGVIDNQSFAGSDFDEGDAFSITITYDTDTLFNTDPTPTATKVAYSNAIKSIRVQSGSYDSTYSDAAGFGYIQLVDDQVVSSNPARDGFRLNVWEDPLGQPNAANNADPTPNAADLAPLWGDDLTPAYEPLRELVIDLYTTDTSFITDRSLPGSFTGVQFDDKTWFKITARGLNAGTDQDQQQLSVQTVPEPSAMSMVALGSLALLRRRSHR